MKLLAGALCSTIFRFVRCSSLQQCGCLASHAYTQYDRENMPFATKHKLIFVKNAVDAKALVNHLDYNEQQYLLTALNEAMVCKNTSKLDNFTGKDDTISDRLTKEQIRKLFLFHCIPFIGFGVLDNLIMIIAGEYIDTTVGVFFGLSTLAAAGIGNIISDIAGVGSAHYIEYVAGRIGLKMPNLSPVQFDSSKARWTTNLGRGIGLIIGCLIGMLPLVFYDETETQKKKINAKGLAESK